MREAVFIFYFIFISSKTDEGGRVFFILFFISSKKDEACICMSCYTLRQCSMGGDPRSLVIFGLIQEPRWTINQAIFLKNGPSQRKTPL